MPSDEVVVSARVPKALRDRIDEIVKELGISNRSVLVRRALISYVERHAYVGIPHTESDIEEEGGDATVERERFVYRKRRRFPAEIRRKPRRRSHERGD